MALEAKPYIQNAFNKEEKLYFLKTGLQQLEERYPGSELYKIVTDKFVEVLKK